MGNWVSRQGTEGGWETVWDPNASDTYATMTDEDGSILTQQQFTDAEGNSAYQWVRSAAPTAAPKTWQDIALENWQEARDSNGNSLVSQLSQLRPGYDWTNELQQSIANHNAAFGSGWTQWSSIPAIVNDVASRAGMQNPYSQQQIQQSHDSLVSAHTAANQDDGGFGSLFGLIISGVGLAMGIPPIITSAINTVVSGNFNPISFLASAAGNLFSGAEAMVDVGAEFGDAALDAANTWAGDLPSGFDFGDMAEATTGLSSQPENIMLASAGVSDVPQGIQGEVSGPDAGGAVSGFGDSSPQMPAPDAVTPNTNAAFTPSAENWPSGASLGDLAPAGDPNSLGSSLDRIMGWVEKNKGTAGIIAGAIGGAGKGLFDSMNMDKKIAADRALMEQRGQTELAVRDGIRNANTVPAGSVGVRPSGDSTLRRPDGSPVYGPRGLIARAMR